MTADDAWGGQVEGAPTTDLATFGAEPNPAALDGWWSLRTNADNTLGLLRSNLRGALAAAEAAGREVEALDLITWVQETRRQLAEVEQEVTRWAGLSGITKTGEMPDGRRYTIRRGRNRKGWDHDRWKHDARAAVVRSHGLDGRDLVDPATGDLVDLQGLLTHVQEFHGAGAPRVTALKQAGLDPDDYAETSPGAWGIEFVDPDPA